MEPIQIIRKSADGSTWRYAVLLGHDSEDVGFLVKIDRQHWETLTGGRVSPEDLIKKCFRFLLKKQSKYSIMRSFDVWEVQRKFPDFAKEF